MTLDNNNNNNYYYYYYYYMMKGGLERIGNVLNHAVGSGSRYLITSLPSRGEGQRR